MDQQIFSPLKSTPAAESSNRALDRLLQATVSALRQPSGDSITLLTGWMPNT
ncbi:MULTISPECIES: hypothetical protein [Mesorhizobium]|uniref:Uncharacterized protein n=1 Tax=Mesorhizobium opportunistum (strain LMG 24607 / HAMBI 3007 / WSM2075) TaxID=536019 RepID=F7YBI7_MESOW|nr:MULTISPECIES: hypothetical protein [Mesorhizobium]AEH87734.1 hypothetical protein Mesop_3284 [Mesorhizobium opportunistum WSM2075]MCA0035232.1 hypothetical protein [Mesorhizobium sp. B263B2A]